LTTNEPIPLNADGAASLAAEQATALPVTEVTLENGVALRLKPVPPFAIRNAAAHLKRPEVPIWVDPDKGREEPNPNDPDYQAAVRQYVNDQAEAALTVALLLGTEVISVPEGMYGVADERWAEEVTESMALAGGHFEVHASGKARYLDWLRMYAIPSEIDNYRLTRILTSGVGLTEAEVQRSVESFRSLYRRSPDLVAPAPVPPIDGDHGAPVDPGDDS
jgi:hypothetical protein